LIDQSATKGLTMTRKITAVTARTQFGQILDRAVDHNDRFLVERNGEPAVLILSVTDFVKTLAPTPDWLKDIQADAKRKGVDKLTMADIDGEIAAARRERRQRNIRGA
jgi:prevent-host-death family protein